MKEKQDLIKHCEYQKVPKGNLEIRMYYFTIYQLNGIQKGIQAGHAALKYGRKYKTPEFFDFIDNWETTVILNGGTTNWTVVDNVYTGTLNQIVSDLHENDVNYMLFTEPDLNDSLTAVCFLVDERVFDLKKYPDYNYEDYNKWLEKIGGKKNEFIRSLLKNKKLA